MLQVAEDTLICRDCGELCAEDKQAEDSYDGKFCLCLDCDHDRDVTHAEWIGQVEDAAGDDRS